MDKWTPQDRYQVMREAVVQKLDGREEVLPLGFAEIWPQPFGQRVTMPLKRVRIDPIAGKVDRIVLAGNMRKL